MGSLSIHRTFLRVLSVLAAAFIVSIVIGGLFLVGAFNRDVWDRDAPLHTPIALKEVRDGVIILADDRAYRPAGITRRDDVSPADFDAALRTVAAQGILVDRDLGDGRAFLHAEPKFYNHCGYRNRWGRHWAGRYVNCDASLALVTSGYARIDLDQPGLSDLDRWRFEGLDHLISIPPSPQRISDGLVAFDTTAQEHHLAAYDTTLAIVWHPPPKP